MQLIVSAKGIQRSLFL